MPAGAGYMRYRYLGGTGLLVSEIGFGCGDNAGLMIAGTLDEQCRVVERAIAAGINYFDTAAGYGSERSETSLGRVLRRLGVQPIVNTKVEVELAQVDDVAAAVIASVNGSLERLQLDSVDIVMIHNSPVYRRLETYGGWMPMTIEEYLGPRGALHGMEELRQQGKVRFFGIVNERQDVELARRLLGTGRLALLNVQYNLLNPTAGMARPPGLRCDLDNGDIISFAAQRNVGAAIFSPLARGVLTAQAVAGGQRHPLAGTSVTRDSNAYQALLAKAQSLSFLAREGRSLSQAAVRFILMHPGVTTVLGGFTAVEQVDDLAAAPEMDELTEQELARVEMVWRSNFGAW
jgi:aryl-alcohol dehydrogenase-like predicted oxidoreductase